MEASKSEMLNEKQAEDLISQLQKNVLLSSLEKIKFHQILKLGF